MALQTAPERNLWLPRKGKHLEGGGVGVLKPPSTKTTDKEWTKQLQNVPGESRNGPGLFGMAN